MTKSFLQKMFFGALKLSTKWGCIHLKGKHIALAKDRISRHTTNLNVKLSN